MAFLIELNIELGGIKNFIHSFCNIELKVKKSKLNKKIIIPTRLHYSDIINKDLFDLIKNDLIKKLMTKI